MESIDYPRKIEHLPNELLISILAQFPTRFLLSVGAVSRHFHSVALCILRQRLNRASSLPGYRMMLECYHPVEKLYTPYLYCDHLYTDSLEGLEAASDSDTDSASSLCGLRDVYSHFRPLEPNETRRERTRTGGRYPWRGRRRGSSSAGYGREDGTLPQPPHIDIYLDIGELFSQLCTTTNIVRVGPRPGLFLSHVNVSDDVVRVWRDWLAEQAAIGQAECEGAVLWVDSTHDVGLKLRVAEKDIQDEHPVLVANDEELPVAYRLTFEELLVRTGKLLLMLEKGEAQEATPGEGKALVVLPF